MSNSTLNDDVGSRMRNDPVVSSGSSPSLISVVIVCMTIMAVCALVYFAIRCYIEERRLRASAKLCKCLPSASSAECGNSCRYVERRAVHVAVQTSSADQPVATSWAMSDVRTEARRTGFSSPVANNEAVPNWRPPATGSSQRQTTCSQNHYRFSNKSSQRQKHRHHRQAQRRGHYQDNQEDQDDECYPLRRSRLVNMRPSIQIQSPSSSDSYSVLTMSINSKSVAMLNKESTAVTFSEDEDDRLLHQHQYNKSGLSEAGHSYVSNPYHPRYNTPVSELNNNDVVVVDIEDVGRPEEENIQVKMEADDDRKWTEHEPGRLVDGATQSCPSSVAVWDNLKRCQEEAMMTTASSLDTISADLVTRLDTLAGRMPLKGTFPSCEVLAGGRLINRWTQTDNASLASLDWDNYDCERMRLEVMDPDVEEEDIGCFHRLANVDEGVEGMTGTTSSTTLLMVSHGSADTTLQASRISHRSASSPYVLCFECSEDFSVNDERRASGSFVPRRTSSPPHPRRQRSSAGSPLQSMAPLPPSPLLQSSCHHPADQHQPDGQDGRSSKAVKPRRK